MELSGQEYYLPAMWFVCLLGCLVNPEAWMIAIAATVWYTVVHIANKMQLIGSESTEQQKRNSRKAFLQMM